MLGRLVVGGTFLVVGGACRVVWVGRRVVAAGFGLGLVVVGAAVVGAAVVGGSVVATAAVRAGWATGVVVVEDAATFSEPQPPTAASTTRSPATLIQIAVPGAKRCIGPLSNDGERPATEASTGATIGVRDLSQRAR